MEVAAQLYFFGLYWLKSLFLDDQKMAGYTASNNMGRKLFGKDLDGSDQCLFKRIILAFAWTG
jgi:hypothetical protein